MDASRTLIRVRTIAIDPADHRIDPADYHLIAGWWAARHAEAPPRTVLPTLGVIASHGDTPLAAAFCYLDATGSGVAWLAWQITDPAATPLRAGLALKRAVDFLHLEARRLDYWLAWTTVANPSLVSFLKRDGYAAAESGLTHLFKPLPPLQPDEAADSPHN